MEKAAKRHRKETVEVIFSFIHGSKSSNEVHCGTSALFAQIQKNRFFKFTDAFGVGLSRIMELHEVNPGKEAFDRWSAALKWVPVARLVTWDEFCADQIRMQGVEVIQRAAVRLESKVAAFDDKKRALPELNEMIEERRAQLILEAKE